MKENKKFSHLEMEELVEPGSLVLEEEEPTGELIIEQYLKDAEEDPSGELIIERYLEESEEEPTGELIIERYLEESEEEPTGELVIERYLEDAEGEPTGELVIERYLEDAEGEPTGELVIERYPEDAEGEPTGELVIEQYLEDVEEDRQRGFLEELANEIESAQSVRPESELVIPDHDMQAEVEQTLLSISRTLDQLINESDDYVQQKQRELDDRTRVLAEKEYDPVQTQGKEKEPREQKSNLVPDLFAQREWHLVTSGKDYYDDSEKKYTDSVLPGPPASPPEKVVNPEPPEKKSLGSLSTALLAGGGVLVFGLATAGVVTAIKSYRKKSQQPITVWNESPVTPVTPVIQPVEKDVEQVDPPKEETPEPPPVNHHPAAGGNMYRAPMSHRPPVVPLFGFGRPNHWQVG